MITTGSNSRIKRLIQLNQKAKVRKAEGVFVVEGTKMFLEAPACRVREVYVSESFLERCTCREKLEQTGYEVVADPLFSKISDTCTPQGILCVVEQFHYNMKELLQKENALLLVLENIQDPGNLGTMLRTAEGAGVDGVIMSRDTVDIYNPKVIRSTMGSVYRMPFLYVEDLAETIGMLKEAGVNVCAAHLKGNQSYTEADYSKKTAFLIGNEGNGLKAETAEMAGTYIKIPMEGKVESLNAAVAAAILMYEAARQRRWTEGRKK